MDSLQTAVGYEYLRTPALHLEDGGQAQISQQRGFQYVNPTDEWFPGKKILMLLNLKCFSDCNTFNIRGAMNYTYKSS